MRDSTMRWAGMAVADITPRGRCELNGFTGRRQPCLGVGRRIDARVLVLASDRSRAVLVSCDLLGFSTADSARIERAVARAAGAPARSVVLACTHTHSAPMSMYLGDAGRYDRPYVQFVERQLVEAARAAVADLRAVASARFGTSAVPALGSFRCEPGLPGRGRWPGTLSVLQLRRDGGAPVTVFHLGLHPLVLGPGNRRVHPDYPGAARDTIRRVTGGEALFVQGCGADVNPRTGFTRSAASAGRVGREVAAGVMRALRRARPVTLAPMATAGTRLGLPTDPDVFPAEAFPDWVRKARQWKAWKRGQARGRWPRRVTLPLRVMRWGDVLLVGMAAELFHDTGEDLARRFPGMRVMVLSQAGGDIGYLPRPFAYRRFTYEAGAAHIWYGMAGPLARGSEAAARRRIVQQVLATGRRGRAGARGAAGAGGEPGS